MNALAEIRTKVAALRPAALAGAKQSPPHGDAATQEYIRLRNVELKLEQEAVEHVKACRASGVTDNFIGKTFDTFDTKTEQQRAAVAACREFVDTWWTRKQDGEYSSLWFLGPTGTGKTRLASALVSALAVDEGASARIVTPTDLIRQLRDTWGQRGKEQALLREVAAIEVLVIDDLGRSFGSAFEVVQLTEVIDMRYTKGNPTLLTSNKNEPQLKKVLGERAFDRLRHGRKIVPLTGESYRRTATVA